MTDTPDTIDELAATQPAPRNRRRRAVAFLGIGAVALTGLGLGSNALFSDSEGTNDNTFTAGTLDLVAGQSTGDSVNFNNLAPGDTETKTIKLSNAGTLDLKYTMADLTITGTPGLNRDGTPGAGTQVNDQNDETVGVERDRDAPGGAYLPLSLTAFLDDNANGTQDTGEATVYSNANIATGLDAGGGTLDAGGGTAATGYIGAAADAHEGPGYTPEIITAVNASLVAGSDAGKTVTVVATYPKLVDEGVDLSQNAEQGASATFALGFDAVQVANN